MTGALGALRQVRLRAWGAWMRWRLGRRGVHLDFEVGSAIRWSTLPNLRLVDRGPGGSIRLRIGDRVDLGHDLFLDFATGSDVQLDLGPGVEIEHGVRLQVLGGTMEVGRESELSDGVVLKTTELGARLVLGERIKVMRRASVQCHERVVLHDLVGLAENVTIVDSYHDLDGSDEWCMAQPVRARPIEIGRNTIVFTQAIVTHGATIGPNSQVAANAFVRAGTYGPRSVLVGSPARVVRKLPGVPEADTSDARTVG